MSKQKMNTSSSVHQHQLSRKNNDSHSRKLHNNYQDFVPITKKTSNPPNPPPKRKRSLSALKLDLLATTSHNTLNQPLKKSKPDSPSSHQHHQHQQLHTTPLKPIKKNHLPSPANRNPILFNITNFNSLKPVEKKKEKNPKVDDVLWRSLFSELRPKPAAVEARANNPPPKPKLIPIVPPVRAMVSTKPSKPIHCHEITTPLRKMRPLQAEDTRRGSDLIPAGLAMVRPSKPPAPSRQMRPIVAPRAFTPITLPKPPSPMVSPSKRKNRVNAPTGELLDRARRLIEIDQSSRRMWQSDLDAGALRPGKTRQFQIVKVVKENGSQIAHCLEIHPSTTTTTTTATINNNTNGQALTGDDSNSPTIWKILLRGPDCHVNDRLKIFAPWSELPPNILLSNKYITN
ncbi:hypothetical protein PGTUg99_011660 [Puccinia graminis f. sp. tritici]|uniref:Uncharacterized protein n=1 Tax=Puccinia graminis f. sp. tritici TaxID=56615 RepID=A0A5B0SHR7_PUCGR|nr:hypothetical protein PGTUg99_011660 [Puccinia graminis f. sp. tritici]